MQGPLTQLADGVPLLDTLRRTGYVVNWDATFWWPYIMMIAPTLRPSVPGVYDNATELWGSSFDKQPGFNNRLSRVHVHASYAIRYAVKAVWPLCSAISSASKCIVYFASSFHHK